MFPQQIPSLQKQSQSWLWLKIKNMSSNDWTIEQNQVEQVLLIQLPLEI